MPEFTPEEKVTPKKVEGPGPQTAQSDANSTTTAVLTSKAEILRAFGRSAEELYSAAMKPINKEGLTAAGRALTKHAVGQRDSGTFPRLVGGIDEQNAIAAKVVREILEHPDATFTILRRGDLEIRVPDGRGIRFEKNGSLSAFLDPRF